MLRSVTKSNWKLIKNYELSYRINQNGDIENINTNKLIKQFIGKDGYKIVTLWSIKNKKYHTLRVHRLVAEAFILNPLKLPYINHKDENKLNNEYSNLEWCTAKYNCNYKNHNKNLSSSLKGRKSPNKGKYKLTKEQKEQIKRSDLSNVKLGKIYNVSAEVIRRCKKEK